MRQSRPLRICQVVPYDLNERGGVKHHAAQLAHALRARGDLVTVIGPGAPSSEPNTFSFPGTVNIKSNGSDNRVGLFVAPWRVRSFFRRNQFDIVHLHEPLTPSLSYWALWFSPDSAHLATFHAFSETPRRPLDLLSRLGTAAIRNSFQIGMAVSPSAATYAPASWRDRLSIVPNGVPTNLFVPRLDRRQPGPVRLLFVGRIGDTRKGYRYVDLAFRRLRSQGFDITLDVVGETGGSVLPEPAAGLTYHGALSMGDLIQRYQQADIFVAPSTGQESFGIVLLEAMACGLPVVCSDIDGYRNTVVPEGSRLTRPRDVDSLERAIVDLAGHPERWSVMGEINRRRAAAYDWQQIAHQVRNLYFEALRLRSDQKALGPRPQRLPMSSLSQDGSGVDLGHVSRSQGETMLDV